jgi:hypothetical protein
MSRATSVNDITGDGFVDINDSGLIINPVVANIRANIHASDTLIFK